MESIVIQDRGVVVTQPAPEETEIDLAVLLKSDSRTVHLERGDHLVFGTFPDSVLYQIVGWNPDPPALRLQKVDY